MIDKIDNILLSLAQKTAEKREDVTGKHKEQLERIFYLSSSVGFATAAIIDIGPMSVLNTLLSVLMMKWSKNPPSSLVLQSAPSIFPVGMVMSNSAFLLYDLLALSFVDAQEIQGIESNIFLSSSFILTILGGYIGRADTKGPPKKSKLAKLKDKAVETLAGLSPPKLSPQPIKNT